MDGTGMEVFLAADRSPCRGATHPTKVPAYPCYPFNPWFQQPFPGSRNWQLASGNWGLRPSPPDVGGYVEEG